MTHATSSTLAESEPCMWGNATLVTLVSSTCMTATTMTEKVSSHLRLAVRSELPAASAAGASRGDAAPGPRRAGHIQADSHDGRHAGPEGLGGAGGLALLAVQRIFTGTRCTTFTQFPVAFSGGSSENREPVPALIEFTVPVKATPGWAVDADLGALAGPDARELRLLEVGDHPHVVERHQRQQRLARTARSGRPRHCIGDDTVDGRPHHASARDSAR